MTLHFYFAAVQFDAALYDHESEAGTRTVIDVKATMEGVEEPLFVGLRDTDTFVADNADNLCFGAPDFETHQPACG